MDSAESRFQELVKQVCERPGMFSDGSYLQAATFIDGYWYALEKGGYLQYPELTSHDFSWWLAKRMGCSPALSWICQLESSEKSDEETLNQLKEELLTYYDEVTNHH